MAGWADVIPPPLPTGGDAGAPPPAAPGATAAPGAAAGGWAAVIPPPAPVVAKPPGQAAEPQGFTDFFTGNARTEFPDAPELSQLRGHLPKGKELTFRQNARLLGAYATSAEPEQIADIASKTLKGSTTSRDKYGNLMLHYEGQNYYINKPGLSQGDLVQAGGVGVEAALAARGYGGFRTPGRVIGGAVTGGGLSVGNDLAAQALGSDQPVSGTRALVSTGAGGAAETMGPVINSIVGAVRQMRNTPRLIDASGTLTDEGRKLFEQVGINPEQFTAAQLRTIAQAAARTGVNALRATTDMTQAATQERGGVGVALPRTPGQRSNSPEQLSWEDQARNGMFGQTAQRNMQEFDRYQRQMIDANLGDMRQRMAGNPAPGRDIEDIGASMQGRVARARDASDAAVKGAYNALGDMGPEGRGAQSLVFAGRQIDDLNNRVRKDINARFQVTPQGMPETHAVLGDLNRFVEQGHMDLGEALALRQRIGNAARSNPGQRAPLTATLEHLDDWMNTNIQRANYLGDDASYALLRRATDARAEFGRMFEANRAPQSVQHMLEVALRDGVTGKEFFNALYGAGSIGSRDGTRAAMNHLETMFGRDSPMFNELREGAISRILAGQKPGEEPTIKMMAQRLNDAMSSNGRAVMEGLFTPAQMREFRSIATDMREIAERSARQNPSGTAYTAASFMGRLAKMVVATTAAGAAGVPPVLGGAVAHGAMGALGAIANARHASRAADILANPRSLPGPGTDLRDLVRASIMPASPTISRELTD